jgi:hypothetical protein
VTALVIWDNLACVHDNPAFPRDQARQTWFLNVLNDRPIEPLEAGSTAGGLSAAGHSPGT